MHQKTNCQRYYYTSQKSFEQSVDVWKPTDTDGNADLPLVVLVVGSAWLGHRSIIYTGTSWRNSSGPRAFVRQGCVTVCVRHRGAFPRLLPHEDYHPNILLPLLIIVAMLVGIVLAVIPNALYGGTTVISIITTLFIVVWGLLTLGASGAAEFDDMLHDVADAFQWVNDHKDTEILSLPKVEEEEKKSEENKPSETTLVFGGYSSGGHVAATLLQRPGLFQARGLPPPETLCDAALFISGVLAVRPPPTHNSRWCTDLVTRVVFGKDGSTKLPSPLHGIKQQPRIPHVLIGCKNEVFGLDWMDVFFCSRDFCATLEKDGVPDDASK